MFNQKFLSVLDDYHRLMLQFQNDFSVETMQLEEAAWRRYFDFVKTHSECFERTLLKGHVTGSAFVVNPQIDAVLLTYHRKLNKWLQLGGHADGESDVENVALREAMEESGLHELSFVKFEKTMGIDGEIPIPFDLDIHSIPERGNEPEHFHFDARYLIVASHPEKIAISEESIDLRWFPLNEVHKVSSEFSLLRQVRKAEIIRSKLFP